MSGERREYPYFVGNVVLQTAYFRFPVALVKEDAFKKLTWLEKMTYVLLLDKASFSVRMGKLDGRGRPYVDDFTRKDIMSISGCSEETAKRVFRNLSSERGIGLIEMKRVPGSASTIYVKDFMQNLSVKYFTDNRSGEEKDGENAAADADKENGTVEAIDESSAPGAGLSAYISAENVQKFRYWMIPQIFFTKTEYRNMRFESKLIYAMLLSRTMLSSRNGMVDEMGRIFVYYGIRSLKAELGIGSSTAVECMKELEVAGLIEREYRQDVNRERIYVKNFVSAADEQAQEEAEVNQKRGQTGNAGQNGNDERGVKPGTQGNNGYGSAGSNEEHLDGSEAERGSNGEQEGAQNENAGRVREGAEEGSRGERRYTLSQEPPVEISFSQDIFFSSDEEEAGKEAESRPDTKRVSEGGRKVSWGDKIKSQIRYDELMKRNPGQEFLAGIMVSVMKGVLSGKNTYGLSKSHETYDTYQSIDMLCFEDTMRRISKNAGNINGRIEYFIASALYNNARKKIIASTTAKPPITDDVEARLERYKAEIREMEAQIASGTLSFGDVLELKEKIELKKAGLKFYGVI